MSVRSRLLALFSALLVLTVARAGERELTLTQRLTAERAIERVLYRHQLGATRPFEEVVTAAALDHKVRRTLARSVLLAERWNAPVTAAMLERELARIARNTRFPERLAGVYAALGYDAFLVQECFVRPVLVERLTRSFLAHEERLGASAPPNEDAIDIARAKAVASPGVRLPEPGLLGGASCPADDSWTLYAGEGASPRWYHKAVWTGREMIVWGGQLCMFDSPSNAGGRYDPLIDAWSPISSAGMPPSGTPLWTGTKLIVWGFDPGDQGPGAGARYDPVTDTWAAISRVGAPSPRTAPAVWTGAAMLVWGGSGQGVNHDDGAGYDPATDTWSPLSATGAPTARYLHSAVWTGSELLVWGGRNGNALLGDGARYAPGTDSWTPLAAAGAPSARREHRAAWTGTEMLVWGGYATDYLASGGRYNPQTDQWQPTSLTGAPTDNPYFQTVWADTRLLIWGGFGSTSGYRYVPASDSWAPLSATGQPQARKGHTVVWTGDEMIVWGGGMLPGEGVQEVVLSPPTMFPEGGRYVPQTDTWRSTVQPVAGANPPVVWTGRELIFWGAEARGTRWDLLTDAWMHTSADGAPTPRWSHTAVWTGSEMIVWGGENGTNLASGGRYDPLLDRWTATAATGAPLARRQHTALWTGSEMLVWGGRNANLDIGQGGRYSPLSDSWTPMAVAGEPSGRRLHRAVWTGSEMLVWGGSINNSNTNTGGRYDRASNSWQPTSLTGAPSSRSSYAAVWTGSEMLVWGPSSSGGRYDPGTNSWTSMSTVNAPGNGWFAAGAWDGDEAIVWSIGFTSTPGGRYDPLLNAWTPIPTAGSPLIDRITGIAVSGGALFWGERYADLCVNPGALGGFYAWGRASDDDGDGTTECAGDCNDAAAGVWSWPGEVTDLAFVTSKRLVWTEPVQPGASIVTYDVLRSNAPGQFIDGASCVEYDGSDTTATDQEEPGTGGCFFYLVRAGNGCPLGYGPLNGDEVGRHCP